MSLAITVNDNTYNWSNDRRRNLLPNVNSNLAKIDAEIRKTAHLKGKEILNDFLKADHDMISTILQNFDSEGRPLSPVTATTFSDLYKWTMLPVIFELEKIKGLTTVTFGIDLRDKQMRQAIKADPVLRAEIHKSLKELELRKFDIDVFNSVLTGSRSSILTKEQVSSICLNSDNTPRTLVDEGGVRDLGARNTRTDEDADKVTVEFYHREDVNYEEGEEGGVYFIEATGPWHKVTWLETSMMQCVYETKLRYDLRKKGRSYDKWLYGALLRCCKSIVYTLEVQKIRPIKPALFTGRRTGGFVFILLQNILFAKYLGAIALGTSSCDAWAVLTKLRMPCVQPVGTNAHELRMVTSVLFPELDQNPEMVPLTQIVVDELYRIHVQEKTKGPMPMLPDTLGTRAYLQAAKYVRLSNNDPYLSLITSARQDSGSLKDFLMNIDEFKFNGSTMASEIDSTKTLLEAANLGYTMFGAGGFFGDSEKVWGNPIESSNSMAVKAVRVKYTNKIAIPDGIPYMESSGLNITGYPVKIGDPEDRDKPEVIKGKLSLDKNLPIDRVNAIRDYALAVRIKASGPMITTSSITIDELLGKLYPHVGGRYMRKSRKRKHRVRRQTRNRR